MTQQILNLDAMDSPQTNEYLELPSRSKRIQKIRGVPERETEDMNNLLNETRRKVLDCRDPIKPYVDTDHGDSTHIFEGSPSVTQLLAPEHSDLLVSSGVGATVLLLKRSGIIGDPSKQVDEEDSSKFEYYNEYGMKLTVKEAFKHMSQRFHRNRLRLKGLRKAIKVKNEPKTRIKMFPDDPPQNFHLLQELQQDMKLPVLPDKKHPLKTSKQTSRIQVTKHKVFGMI